MIVGCSENAAAPFPASVAGVNAANKNLEERAVTVRVELPRMCIHVAIKQI